jgi:putative SOS response-associated peptidase YedK
MCGRYSITSPPEAMIRLFRIAGAVPNFPARYNVAPTQDVPAVVQDAGARALAMLRWGLIPSWAKEGAKPLINARGESVADKPSFRAAFRRRRCLLPADGFYEWHRPDGGPKTPYNIRLKEDGPFAMAGIWDLWTSPDGSELATCAIITTEANKTLAPIHHRMPVILAPEDWSAWLETPETRARDVLPLLRPAPDDLLEAYPISTRVNRVANDGPELIEPARAQGDEQKVTECKKPKKAGAASDPNQGSLF